MADRELMVLGDWPLRAALIAEARRRGLDVRHEEAERPALRVDGMVHELPSLAECEGRRTSAALGHVVDGLGGTATGAVATILGPAAGLCGPSAAGPVDAVRDGGLAQGYTAGRHPVPWSARTLTDQQTRVWIASTAFTGDWSRPAGRPGLEVLPAVVARDSARIAQFQLDRGAGPHWPGVLLLSTPEVAQGLLTAVAVYTDGVLCAHLLDGLLDPERLDDAERTVTA